MGVIFNQRTSEIKYLDNDVVENQHGVHSDEEIKPLLNHPPPEAPTEQPSNQMIMDYLHRFKTDVMSEIEHLSSMMDQWEIFQDGFLGGGSNSDGNDM